MNRVFRHLDNIQVGAATLHPKNYSFLGHKKLARIGVGSKFRAGLAIYKISEKGNP